MITSKPKKLLKKSSVEDVAKELTEGLGSEDPSWTNMVDLYLDEFGCPFFPYLMKTHSFSLSDDHVEIVFEDGKITIPRFDAVVFWTSFRPGITFEDYQTRAQHYMFEDIDYDFSVLRSDEDSKSEIEQELEDKMMVDADPDMSTVEPEDASEPIESTDNHKLDTKEPEVPAAKRRVVESADRYLSVDDEDVPTYPMTGLEVPYGYSSYAIYSTTSRVLRLRIAPIHHLGESMRRYVDYQYGTLVHTGYLYRSPGGLEVFDEDCELQRILPPIFCTFFSAFWNENKAIRRRVPGKAEPPMETRIDPRSVLLGVMEHHPKIPAEVKKRKNTYEEIGLDFPLSKCIVEPLKARKDDGSEGRDGTKPGIPKKKDGRKHSRRQGIRDQCTPNESLACHASRGKRKKSSK